MINFLSNPSKVLMTLNWCMYIGFCIFFAFEWREFLDTPEAFAHIIVLIPMGFVVLLRLSKGVFVRV